MKMAAIKMSAKVARPEVAKFATAVSEPVELGLKTTTLSPKVRDVLENLQPQLNNGGLILLSADANDVGADDLTGHILIYGASVLDFVLYGETEGEDFPALPEALAQPLTEKISAKAKTAMFAVMVGVGIAQAQLAKANPKAATAFRYINKVLTALLTTGIVPAPPAALAE